MAEAAVAEHVHRNALETPRAEWTQAAVAAVAWNTAMTSLGGMALYSLMLVRGTDITNMEPTKEGQTIAVQTFKVPTNGSWLPPERAAGASGFGGALRLQ